MASYCPTCKGILRPERGTLVCIRCSREGRARTVLAAGKRIHLPEGQQGLGTLPGAASTPGFDPVLQPKASTWKGHPHGHPHPQLGLFPYDEIRDGQKRFTRDVTLAVQGRRHLVAQAPTGIGKTAASLAPALQAALDQKKVVLFLTSRQSQHRIAVETLRQIQVRRGARFGLVDLVSKRDMCLRHEAAEMHPARFPDFCSRETRSKNCSYLGDIDDGTLHRIRDGVLHVEELMQVAKESQLCPHLVAMTSAKEAQVVVADYNHLFSDIRDQSLERLGVELSDLIVIVDEAHNLPDRIRQSHSHRVTPYLLQQVESEAREHKYRDTLEDLAALRKALAGLAKDAETQGRAQAAKLGDEGAKVARLDTEDLHRAFEAERNQGTLGLHRTLQDVVGDLGKLTTKVRKGTDAAVHAEELGEALEDWGRFRTGALRYVKWDGTDVELHVRLLDPSVPARLVFDRVHSAVLMSGTLRPPEMVRDLLGLEAERTLVRVYPNPYPPENRLVCVAQGYTTRFQERGEALWNKVAATVADVAASAKGNLAVFAPSYNVLRDVRIALSHHGVAKELVVEEPGWSKAERDRVLDTLTGARKRKGAILLGVLGGSFSEGVDFKDNLLSAVVVVGLPLAPPDLEVEATIGYFERKHPGRGRAYAYVYPAMNKVLQAMGRGIRGPTDKCAILLLDERYLRPPYRQLLPDDGPVVPSPDPAFTAAAFLAAHGL